MKKHICTWISAAIICATLCGTLPVSAEQAAETHAENPAEASDSCGENLTWNFDSESGTLTISGSGAMDFHGEYYAPWANLRGRILAVSLPDELTKIDTNAFAELRNLKSVTIPESVTEIGACAFYDCTSLDEIRISDRITKVGEEILTGTAWLDSQPDGVVYLGNIAVGYHGNMPQQTEIEIRQGTTVLAENLFYAQENLCACTLPDGIIEIPEGCFSLCTALNKITIPDSVERVEDAFQNVVLPADEFGVMYVGKWAVGCNNAVSEIRLRQDTKGIADRAFQSSNVKSIELNDGLTYIGTLAFSGSKIESLMIPDTVKSVGAGLCNSCSLLKAVHLPDSVTVLADVPVEKKEQSLSNGMGFFENCTSLEQIDLPAHLTEIGESAFYGCEKLNEIVIPESVQKIGHSAFGWCKGLRAVTVLNPACVFYDSPLTISDSFSLAAPQMYVYKGVLKGYEDSPCEEYAAKYGIEFEPIVPEGTYLRGDLNGDGQVSLEDAQSCLRAYCRALSKKPIGLEDAVFRAADIDKDGSITPEDATYILRYYTVSELSGNRTSWKQVLAAFGK